jgi:hypothetical protein
MMHRLAGRLPRWVKQIEERSRLDPQLRKILHPPIMRTREPAFRQAPQGN